MQHLLPRTQLSATGVAFCKSLAVIVTVALASGCRPDITFTADSTNVKPGANVTLNWDVDLARRSSTPDITLTQVGKVKEEGSATVTPATTTDYVLTVRTNVFGMPVRASETVTVSVLDKNFASWDFDLGTQGWTKHYTFHNTNRADVICSVPGDPQEPAVTPTLNANLGNSLRLCSDNSNTNNGATLSLAQRKIVESDGFTLNSGQAYRVSMELKYGIKLSATTCANIEQKITDGLVNNFYLVTGVSRDALSFPVNNGFQAFDITSLLAPTESAALTQAGVNTVLDRSQFETIINGNLVAGLSRIEAAFGGASTEDIKQACDAGSELAVTQNLSTNSVLQTPDNRQELYAFVGMYNASSEPDVEILFDSVSLNIVEPSESAATQ